MHGRRIAFLALIFFLTGTLTLGCRSLPSSPSSVATSILHGTPLQVRERLLTYAPLGTPREDAERRLQSLGLELTPRLDLDVESLNSIYFRHTEKKTFGGETTWLIQIDCAGGVVTDVICEQIGID